MIIYVHAYDIFDRGQTWRRHSGVADLTHVTLQPRDTVADMARRVREAAGTQRSLWTLILNAHGSVDAIHHRPTGALSISDAASLSPPTAHQLDPLRDYFTPGGHGIEIHGCNILAAERGWRLCELLAQRLQVSVYAATSRQRGISPWWSSTPRDEVGAFEGPVMAFRPPDGRFENATRYFQSRGLYNPR